MFENFKDFENFMIFCNTHFELNDVWHFENGDKGILFEGWWGNETGNQKYSPYKLPKEEQPKNAKRLCLSEVYDTWIKVKNNLQKTT